MLRYRWKDREIKNKEIYGMSTIGEGTKRFNMSECVCFDVYSNF